MSQFTNLLDQENLPVRRGKAGVEALSRAGRPVLGELSQNVTTRRNNARPGKQQLQQQPAKTGFTIFCDENAGQVAQSKKATSTTVSGQRCLADKENLGALAPLQKRLVQPAVPLGHVKVVENFSDSSLMETDSPMVVDTSTQEWRVPPICEVPGETVDILSVPEYFNDIYKYLRESELKRLPKSNYMTKQPDISHSMRSILVDWLVEVAEEYKLQTETLYLAVAYIDRFLSYMSVQRSKLQLVGTACMFIAAKYEEIYPPDVGEFVYITDDTYNKRQVLRMEHLVLKVLGFDLSGPSANVFLSQMSELSKTKEKTKHLAMFLSELSLLHGDRFLKFSPSLMAAASLALARHSLGSSSAEVWTSELASFTGYQVEDFRECLLALHSMWGEAAASPQQAINEKYKSSKYHSVSELSPAPLQH